ncbi:multiprotein-bridging factor 1 family protein [Acidovorax sp. NPDC077693]|uniref:helix-turn-helix domain-containing protein n=1 Tax=unclassified Acidovorax TaxID=2684926 RepID=UPI0009EA4F33|nr:MULTISPECIES: helix-turn-helix transcriptional regulator [unclassified Acidovorax]
MQLNFRNLPDFAARLQAERRRQGLSRSQAAAVCNVSPSFIRDAESAPERCSLGKLLLLAEGLGLTLDITWPAVWHPHEDPAALEMGNASIVQGPSPEDSAP